ncbi:hypothetical protein ACLHDG_00930 [Sulfurovum sp. CS9]|uniref:hypothetical protein n=1 Tax=Sulfurovum sp. CS9 TaxID=3391146 RepID=UPI0039E9B451
MNFSRIILFLIIGFLFNACAPKEYVKQNSAFIMFKTPTFKYADMGFVYENSDEVKVEIYGSGQALMKLMISQDKVCMSLLECMSKEEFNQRVLSASYPKDVLEEIFRGKPIMHSAGLEKNRNGFTQKIIKEDKYNIDYSVLNKQIIFRDTINDILIRVKRMD